MNLSIHPALIGSGAKNESVRHSGNILFMKRTVIQLYENQETVRADFVTFATIPLRLHLNLMFSHPVYRLDRQLVQFLRPPKPEHDDPQVGTI